MKKKLLAVFFVFAFAVGLFPSMVKADIVPGGWAFIHSQTLGSDVYNQYDVLDFRKSPAYKEYDGFGFTWSTWEIKPTKDLEQLDLSLYGGSDSSLQIYKDHSYTWRLEGERTVEALHYYALGANEVTKKIKIIGDGTLKVKSYRTKPETDEEGNVKKELLYDGNAVYISVSNTAEKVYCAKIEDAQQYYEQIKAMNPSLFPETYEEAKAQFTLGEGVHYVQNTGPMTQEEANALLEQFDLGSYYSGELKDGYLVITGSSDEVSQNIPIPTQSLTDFNNKGFIRSLGDDGFDSSYQGIVFSDITDKVADIEKTGIRVTSGKELISLLDISRYDLVTNTVLPLKNGKYQISILCSDEMLKNKEHLSVAYVENGAVKENFDVEIQESEMGGSYYLVFTTSHLSNYAVLGADVEVTQAEKDAWANAQLQVPATTPVENPSTADPILMMALLAVIGGVGTVVTLYGIHKRLHNEI